MLKKLSAIGNYSNLGHFWLLCFRVCAGAFLMTHGLAKLKMLFSNESIEFLNLFGLGVTFSLTLAVFAELICAFLVILGLFTRIASIPIIITMLVAIFIVHQGQEFSHKELAYLYLLVYLTLLVFGSGKFSVDKLIK